MLDKEHCH